MPSIQHYQWWSINQNKPGVVILMTPIDVSLRSIYYYQTSIIKSRGPRFEIFEVEWLVWIQWARARSPVGAKQGGGMASVRIVLYRSLTLKNRNTQTQIQTLPKAQRTRGLSSYHMFHTNLDQTSILESRLSIKPRFRILTKIQLCNLNQTSAAKYLPNFSFKISLELRRLTPDQTLCWKSEQKFSFMTKPQLPNLQQTVANTIQHQQQ